MMKAKQYVEEFKAAKNKDQALAQVLTGMHQEVTTLMRQRGVKSDWGMLAIFNEIDDKFRSFARHVGDGVHPKSFAVIIDRFHPTSYEAWVRMFPPRAHGFKEAAPVSEIAGLANCGCVYHAEQGVPCKHDLELAGLPTQ